jgi:hypothetical protein
MFHMKRRRNITGLTPDQIETARNFRRDGWSWDRIAGALLVTAYVVRCELEPGYRDYKKQYARRQWAALVPDDLRRSRPGGEKLRRKVPRIPKRAVCDHRVALDERAPEDVLREREEYAAALEARTDAQKLLGDPPPRYSALSQRAPTAAIMRPKLFGVS